MKLILRFFELLSLAFLVVLPACSTSQPAAPTVAVVVADIVQVEAAAMQVVTGLHAQARMSDGDYAKALLADQSFQTALTAYNAATATDAPAREAALRQAAAQVTLLVIQFAIPPAKAGTGT